MRNERGAIEIQIALFIPVLVLILVGGVAVWQLFQAQQTANLAAYTAARVLASQPATALPGEPPMTEQAIVAAKRQIVANYPWVKVEEDIVIKTIPPYTGLQGWAPVAGDPFEVIVSLKWVIWPGARVDGGPFGFLAGVGRITGRSQGRFLWEREEW